MKPPLAGLLYGKVEGFKRPGDYGPNNITVTTDVAKANVITSMIADDLLRHKVVIDLDLPAKLVPSSTPGHFHLYIDHAMEAEAYFKLLRALSEAGIIEEGYYTASSDQGYSAVR